MNSKQKSPIPNERLLLLLPNAVWKMKKKSIKKNKSSRIQNSCLPLWN